jgi:5-methylcytosine-specific restriction endonuclease McrA
MEVMLVSKRDLTRSMDELFPQEDPSSCRVCNRPVADGRWSYCSERCRDIANAVQRMFIWSSVREQILERDGYTCQQCSLSKERWVRAYRQVKERVKELKAPLYDLDSSHRDLDRWRRADRELWARYDVGAPFSGGFEVDHINRIADGGHPFDEENLQTLCKYCHREKTSEENTTSEPQRSEVTLEEYIES